MELPISNPLPLLLSRAGRYLGHGINHDNLDFTGELFIRPLLDNRGVALEFTATGMDGTLYHKESTFIAPTLNDEIGLWTLNTNTPGVLQHELRRWAPEDGADKTFVFGFNEPADRTKFREEIAIDLWAGGDIGYRYAWGLPGGEFEARSGLRLSLPNAGMIRPDFIKHWSEVLAPDNSKYPGSDELLAYGASLGKKTGLTKIGVHREILPPGRRTSWPHAESHEEEFVYVVEGYPQAWIDGHIYPLVPGDAVGFPAGTGIAHTFINNSQSEVVLIVIGETNKDENKCIYPLHPKRNEEIKEFLWKDSPARELGSHDGLPDKLR